jgi:hypothetical protein
MSIQILYRSLRNIVAIERRRIRKEKGMQYPLGGKKYLLLGSKSLWENKTPIFLKVSQVVRVI